jgi:hypothetical protein
MPFFPPAPAGGSTGVKQYDAIVEVNNVIDEEYGYITLEDVSTLIPSASGGGTIYFWSYISNYGFGPMPPDPEAYGVCVQTAVVTDGSLETSWRRIRTWDGNVWSNFFAWERTDVSFGSYLSTTDDITLDHVHHLQTLGMNRGSLASVVTVPRNADKALDFGFMVDIVRKPADRPLTLRAQHSKVTLQKLSSNIWLLSGDLG